MDVFIRREHRKRWVVEAEGIPKLWLKIGLAKWVGIFCRCGEILSGRGSSVYKGIQQLFSSEGDFYTLLYQEVFGNVWSQVGLYRLL